jgi:hypothetical protein
MNRALLVLLCLKATYTSAQWRNPAFQDIRGGHEIGAYAQAGLMTSSIDYSLLTDFYTGQTLDRGQRESISNRANGLQRGGLDLDYGLFYRHLKDSTKVGWSIMVAERYHGHMAYTGDLFTLAFLGNGSMGGKTANLSGSEGLFMRFKQIQAGLIVRPNNKMTFALGGGLMWGHQLASVNIESGSLYTQPEGEYVDVAAKGSVMYNSPGLSHYFNPAGFGAGFDLMFNYRHKRLAITFEARDMGFISWNASTVTQGLDTALTYSGIYIDLFGSSGDPLSNISADSLINNLTRNRKQESALMVLPTSLMVEVEHGVSKKDVRLYAGIMYRFIPYFPYLYFGTRAGLGKGFGIDGRFAYGGTGSWNIGLGFSKDFGKMVTIRALTYNLEGVFTLGTGTSYALSVIVRP